MTTASAEAVTARHHREIGGPRGLPFLGVAMQLLDDPFTLIEKATIEYGGIVRLRIPGQRAFLLSDPDLVKFAFVETERAITKPPPLIHRVDLALGKGLVTSTGDLWRRNRRIVNPVFTRERLAALEPLIHQTAQATIDRWRDLTVLDVREEMGRALLELVIHGLFSASAEVLEQFDAVARSLLTLFKFVARQFVSAIPYDLYLPTPLRVRSEIRRRHIDRVIGEMVARRRESGEDHDDILGLLMSATDPETGASLTLPEIADEVRTMFLAGYETTASALVFAFHMLSRHPLVRRRLEAELDEVLGGRLPGIEDLPNLPYTLQVFHETMRLYPPAWLIGREPVEDVELGGYLIPKGSLLFVSPWATHRSPRNWDAPLSFDPDRFAPEKRGTYHRFAYIPFGGGSRKCVGTNLAMLEGPLLLAALAQHYRLDAIPGEQLVIRGGLTLDIESGTRVSVTPRRPQIEGPTAA